MRKEEYYKIAKTEQNHWWYRSLHLLVLENIQKHFSEKDIKIIDAGCGTGGLLSFLRKQGYTETEGFDISDVAMQICHEKNIKVFKGDLRDILKYFTPNSADVLISNDTFYFLDIEEQRILTDNIHQLLKENGLVITNIPSLSAFSGIHDRQVGIKKRMERKDIWKIFDRDKYTLVNAIYWPFILSPVIWITRYIQRLKLKFNPHTKINSDLKMEHGIVNSILFALTNIENHALRKKAFGSSLFLVMKKTSK